MAKGKLKKQTRKKYHGEALEAVAKRFDISRTYVTLILNGHRDYAYAQEVRLAYKDSVKQFNELKDKLSKSL